MEAHKLIIAYAMSVSVVLGWITVDLYRLCRKDPVKGWDSHSGEHAGDGIFAATIGTAIAILAWLEAGEATNLGIDIAVWYIFAGMFLLAATACCVEYASELYRKRHPQPQPRTHAHPEGCNCCGIGGCPWQP